MWKRESLYGRVDNLGLINIPPCNSELRILTDMSVVSARLGGVVKKASTIAIDSRMVIEVKSN